MKVLLLGSGALKIGQAGEFDYSGSQAIKALKEEGHKVILINPNIATIQTSEGFADKVYFLPLEPHFIEEVIMREKPHGLLLSMGGQTALNAGLALQKKGVLYKHNVKVLGTPTAAIEKTEDRELFVKTLNEINVLTPKSIAVKNLPDAKSAAKTIGYPVMIRSGFSLGGQDSGIAKDEKTAVEIASRALSKVNHILIEEYLKNWKEIEYEVVRDRFDNTITVCNMENIDPMGIHTGESIVIAPSQTLNNFEYHQLREISTRVIRHLKIVGECNIQFALNPHPKSGGVDRRAPDSAQINDNSKSNIESPNRAQVGKNSTTGPDFGFLDYRIIEVNARLSRSSALASKATGYPLAYIAAKLALGKSLVDIKNSVTKKTIACFEPALDYLIVKIPRWDLSKFVKSDNVIGSSMQSVGEVMAIGRKFEEALQKALRMLDIGVEGILDENTPKVDYKKPTPWRVFKLAQAIKNNVPIDKIAADTGIDKFFLEKIKNICEVEKELVNNKLDKNLLTLAKKLGESDNRISKLTKKTPAAILKLRVSENIHPCTKQIDTLAAEYPAQTNYLYLTYNGETDDCKKSKAPNAKPKIFILGSGPYRIGSSVEFDWCSVTCAQSVRQNMASPIVINCNPETVSTDYDMADKLYFEELSEETILEIYKKENPIGIIVSMGGQRPNNLTPKLHALKLTILGTSPISIDKSEDRNKFSALCDKLKIAQPPWASLKNQKSALEFANRIGYPVLVRPSYVLSGAAMNVAFVGDDLKLYLKSATRISRDQPVVISKYYQNAKEFEIDAVANQGKILCEAICEHVENAGVHSGDSTLLLPAQKLYVPTLIKVEETAAKIAQALNITGPFNIQFLAIENEIMVIECNLRASRSLPFVSKVLGTNFAKVATEAIIESSGWQNWKGSQQRTVEKTESTFQATLEPTSTGGKESSDRTRLNYVGVKAPQFSFSRVKGADPILRVEMSSTGEVACFGDDVYEAFLKSIIATGTHLPKKSVFISLAGQDNKAKFLQSAKILKNLGLKIYATAGTSSYLINNGVKSNMLYKIYENKKPNVLDILHSKKVDLVINIIDPYFKKAFDDDYQIRRTTVDFGIPIITNLQTAELFAASLGQKTLKDLKSLPWNHYVNLK